MMAAKQFGWTLLMLVITAGIVALAVFVQWLFLLIAAGLIAYLHSLILKNIFVLYDLGLPDTDDGELGIPY